FTSKAAWTSRTSKARPTSCGTSGPANRFERADMDSARPFWWPDLQTYVAVAVITLFAFVVVMLLARPMPLSEAAGTLLTALVGLLTGKVATIVDFYFGTSKGRKDKDELAKSQAQTIANVTATPERGTT